MKRLLVVLTSVVLLTITGCKKEAGIGVVGITVVNEDGVPIQNCQVSLSVPVDGAVQFYGRTDEDGFIEFRYGLHVYYDVWVGKGIWEGCDFVEIKPGVTNYKNIIIYPPNTSFNGCI